MSTHSRLSPSAAHRWMRCPASPREEAKYGERKSSPAATDGTHSHTVLEQCLKLSFREADVLVGETLKDDDGEFKVDQERADRVNTALKYIWDQFDSLTTEHVLPKLIAEEQVNPEPFTGRDDIKGTCDVQIVTPTFIEIIDYKDGMMPVDVMDNPQLLIYAMGAICNYPELSNDTHIFDVKMTVIQPKLGLKGMAPINSWTITSDQLRKKIDEIVEAAKRTDDPDSPHVAGDHCKWCAHTGCSERVQSVMKSSGVNFENLDLAKQFAEKESTELSDDELKEIIEAIPLIKQMIETAESEALRRFESGKSIQGLKVVHGRGSRSWAYDEDKMADKLKRMGIPKSSIYTTKLVSPAQVKKLKWKKKHKGEEVQKQLSERQLKTLENEYVKKSSGKLTVVTESDHRDPVTFDASQMFENVSEDGLPEWLK